MEPLRPGDPSRLGGFRILGRLGEGGQGMVYFGWATTMAYAANGSPAFGDDTIPAVMRRILDEEPELGRLTGRLRALAAACLAKDPALRPNAGQVMCDLPAAATGSRRALAIG